MCGAILLSLPNRLAIVLPAPEAVFVGRARLHGRAESAEEPFLLKTDKLPNEYGVATATAVAGPKVGGKHRTERRVRPRVV